MADWQLPQRSTDLVKRALGWFVRPGDQVLDATAGNGHDTARLAELVGESGRVWALDLQEEAIEATRQRLEAAGLLGRVELLVGDHARLAGLLPSGVRGELRAIVFNLGYLPGGDRRVITRTKSTLEALKEASNWLRKGGLLAITVYPGHDGGDEEAAAVDAWVADLPRRHWTAWSARLGNAGTEAPRTHLIQFHGEDQTGS